MSDEPDREGGFKITDHRKFDSRGELRQESASEARITTEPAEPKPRKPIEQAPEIPGKPDGSERIDFSSFVLSLASSALMQLGEIPDPHTGRFVESLPGARQTIDILAILQEKTQGNLTDDEARLMESMLYELRMKCVSRSRST